MSKHSKVNKQITVAVGCLYRELFDNEPPLRSLEPSYEFLLTKRRDLHIAELDGKWELPGGKVEHQELLESCVAREFLEETGYKVRTKEKLGRTYTFIRDYPDCIQYVTVLCFPCVLESSYREHTVHDSKIEQIKWFNPNDIDYRQTLQGSREFIIDVANHLGLSVSSDFEKSSYSITLQVIDDDTPKAKQRLGRWCALTIQFDTGTNEYILVANHGSKQRRGRQHKLRIFDEYESMLSQAKKTIGLRHRHGYAVTGCDSDFPLRDWMQARGILLESTTPESEQYLPIQLPLNLK